MCLKAFEKQTLSKDMFEIIISDDGSDDETPELVANFKKNSDINIFYLRQENKGANSARNNAIKNANGKILLIINDDILPSPEMLYQHHVSHQEYPDENIAALGKVIYAPTLKPTFFSPLHLDAAFIPLENKIELDWRYFFTCNISVKTMFLKKYGLFDEDMPYHEDVELAYRLNRHGLRVIYNKLAIGAHFHELHEEEFFKIAKREGRSLAIWYKKNPNAAKDLSEFGFPLTVSLKKKINFFIGDMLFSIELIDFWKKIAKYLINSIPDMARTIYKKIFQSIKRHYIKKELTI